MAERDGLAALEWDEPELFERFRRCSYAVLLAGSDDAIVDEWWACYDAFKIHLVPDSHGIVIDLKNAPSPAFVDGRIIEGAGEHLYAVLRDVLFAHDQIYKSNRFDLETRPGITNAIFHILRDAGVFGTNAKPDLVVCWGGHRISESEQRYAEAVGYELGLRGLNICTGSGPGAMLSPMQGATIAHAKQRSLHNRYVGLTEPGIIKFEPPNSIVNNLILLPDIEKRLEAFIRLAHGIVIFPGGVGTLEEIMYLFGVMLSPANEAFAKRVPVIFTGPESADPFFHHVFKFIRDAFGEGLIPRFDCVIADPAKVARRIACGIADSQTASPSDHNSAYFSWEVNVDHELQTHFRDDSREDALRFHDCPTAFDLAVKLREFFSRIVAYQIRHHRPGDPPFQPLRASAPRALKRAIGALIDALLSQKRINRRADRPWPPYSIE